MGHMKDRQKQRMRYCVQWKSLYALLRTMDIPTRVTACNGNPYCVTAYNGNLYMSYCVQWKSVHALLRTMDIPTCVTACNGNPYMRYCVQRKSLYALLRTMENPHIRNCVQWKSNSPDADPGPPPAGEIPNPNPRTAL